jgi:pyruvate formate lyase activating enzyme
MREANLYEALADNKVRCNLCAHHCVIADGRKGVCQVRENRGGTLFTLVYGQTIAHYIDPIEKKPLFHFFPGSTAYSIATPGCNFRCLWCQNWNISQLPHEQHLISGQHATPQQIVATAQSNGCRSIAYTYTEPTIFFEYAYDIARLAHAAGIKNIFVTNGYMTTEMLEVFHPYLDAANVDLKAFRNETYRRYVGASLNPVLESMKAMKRLGIWLEVTTLVIPGINDDPSELKDAARFVAQELGDDTPWHISRFFPAHKMIEALPTPIATLRMAKDIGLEEGLKYVYPGNVLGNGNQDTACPKCGRVLLRRRGFITSHNRVIDGHCQYCDEPIVGVGLTGEREE